MIKNKIENQISPKGDKRKRTQESVKCYVAELVCGPAGCGFQFSDSIERVVYSLITEGRHKREVMYKNLFYKLEPPEQMIKTVESYLNNGVSVSVPIYETYLSFVNGNEQLRRWESIKYLSTGDEFEAFSFIDITKDDEINAYKSLKKYLNNPNYFFNDDTWKWELRKNDNQQ